MTIDRDGRGQLDRPGEGAPPVREPAFSAPWPPLALAASFLALYALQGLAGNAEALFSRYGFSPADLAQGRLAGLVTALFVHGGWAHAFLNALGALAFGAPVAQLFGRSGRPALVFFLFFLVCGVLGSLGYAALNWGQPYLLVGASGGVSGLMGAGSRLMQRRDRLSGFLSRPVIGMSAAWVIVNALVAVVGLGAVTGDAPIAWQAHIAGFAAGLLLAGTFARLAGASPAPGD